MAVALGESPRSPERLCSLQELPVVTQSSAPAPSALCSLPEREKTGVWLSDSHAGRPEEDSRNHSGSQPLECHQGMYCHGDQECVSGTLELNCHGNGSDCIRDQRCDPDGNQCHDDGDSNQHYCHDDGASNRHSQCHGVGGEQTSRGGANHLRQQWATHTQPKLHMTGVADSTQDQEKAHWEGGAGVKEGVGVWEDGGGAGVKGSVGVLEDRGGVGVKEGVGVLEDGGGAGVKEGVGVLEDGGGAGVRRGVGMCENEGEERMMKLRGQTVSGTTTGTLSDHHHCHPSPETATTRTPPSSGCSRPSKRLLKTQSVGSISSESLTLSSLWEAPSYDTIPDFLSSLGFDDFDSPELIPDRFIPPELDFVRPSLMRQATLGSVGAEGPLGEQPPSPPIDGLHLGATADSVLNASVDSTATVAQSVSATELLPPQTLALYLPSNSQLPWQPASLETVIEETGSELYCSRPQSQLSARQSPRLNSPRLSIDHTPTQDVPMALEGDVSAGLLGAGLAQRLRLQVQAKEDLRQRQMSLGGESDTSSLYFSVGSHFEEGEGEAANKEGGGVASTEDVVECGGSSRRRRHGNYAPTPQLLLWLESTESATDEADQPWPFSESPSPGHSPTQHTHSGPPSVTITDNSNNNCHLVSEQKLQLVTSHSVPILSSRELYAGGQIKNGVKNQQMSEGHFHPRLQAIGTCLSPAYRSPNHAPT